MVLNLKAIIVLRGVVGVGTVISVVDPEDVPVVEGDGVTVAERLAGVVTVGEATVEVSAGEVGLSGVALSELAVDVIATSTTAEEVEVLATVPRVPIPVGPAGVALESALTGAVGVGRSLTAGNDVSSRARASLRGNVGVGTREVAEDLAIETGSGEVLAPVNNSEVPVVVGLNTDTAVVDTTELDGGRG